MTMGHQFMKQATLAVRRALCRFISNGEDGIRGVAAIELAIIAPILLLFLICTLDLGIGIYRNMQVQNAAQAGAQYAIAHGFQASSISSAVANATSFSGISANPAPNQFCGCAASTGITNTACGSKCSGGSLAATYVTVSAQGTYNTLFQYPIIPNSYTFMAQPTVRIQ
jgi:Flp pilus assembly protein TadG